MQKIVYYITDHGMGHATRAVALIRVLLPQFEIIIRNSNCVDFFKKSLNSVVIYSSQTDVGPKIRPDGISLDKEHSIPILSDWIHSIEKKASLENEFLQKTRPDIIISDISAMPFLAAKKSKILSIAISNFSWLDVLSFLTDDELEILEQCYSYADFAIKLPFGTKMNHFSNKKETGLVSRNLTQTKEKTRELLGLKHTDLVITFALGNSNRKINLDFADDIKIISLGENTIENKGIINLNSWIEGQDIMASSDLVICKCGYGVISECLSNGVPFYYIVDDEHLEQKAMTNELESLQLGKRVELHDLDKINFNRKLVQDLPKLKKIQRDNDSVVKLITEFTSK